MKISFGTADGLHFLRAYQAGTVAADAAAIGELDEVFDLAFPFGDQRATLQIHGKYVRAHPAADGYRLTASSAEVNAEEILVLEEDGAGGLRIRTAHGRYVCAEGGGGGTVVCDRETAGAWETFQPLGTTPAPGPTPGDLPRLHVEDNLRWLASPAGRVDYRSKSAFTLTGRLMAGEVGYVRDYLAWVKAERFSEVRVFLCNTIGGYRSGPDMPGFWPAADQLVQLCADAGLYLRACMIAATEPFGGVWQGHGVNIWSGSVKSLGEQFCVEFATRYRDVRHIVGELFNEPCNIGLRYAEQDVIDLGRKVKAVAPGMLLMGGHYENDRMSSRPFDLVTIHFFRAMEVRGSHWIKRSSEYAPCQRKNQLVPMPALSGEPANAGQWRQDHRNGDVYRDPSISFAAAAMSRAHQYLPCFHSDDGLYTSMPEALTIDHIRAWHTALDAFPMSTDHLWTGHHGLGAGDYWRNVWPDTDNTDEVEQHIRDGKGPWRAYGCGPWSVCFPEPKGWDWRSALEAPAERVATCDVGDFAASVYRRT